MKTNLKKEGPQVILVDFDGTLCRHEWPEIGPMMKNADRVLRRLHKAGHIIVIWTARSGDLAIFEAQRWLTNKEIPYHAFNQLPEPWNSMYGPTQSRKVHGDIIVDDHVLGGLPEDWEEIYDLMVEHHAIENTRGDDE